MSLDFYFLVGAIGLGFTCWRPCGDIWMCIYLLLALLIMIVQWNLCNPTPEFSDILWHPTKIYGPKVIMLSKIKPEYSNILYNPTHFPVPLVCRIRQVPQYINDWFISILLLSSNSLLYSCILFGLRLSKEDMYKSQFIGKLNSILKA